MRSSCSFAADFLETRAPSSVPTRGGVSDRKLLAVILPACDEEECVGAVLDELRAVLDATEDDFLVCVGVNGSRDRTAEIARRHGALVAETPLLGYGHGCQAAIDLLESSGRLPGAYLFFAADGANDPRDIPRLVAAYRGGTDFVLGCRTTTSANRRVMRAHHIFANRLLGGWCGVLTGRFYRDLGPLRLIGRDLFHQMSMREWTYGWTIEPQILAPRLGVAAREVAVSERPRLAGHQKVSKVHWWRSLRIGALIALAGWRAQWRPLPQPAIATVVGTVPVVASTGNPSALGVIEPR